SARPRRAERLALPLQRRLFSSLGPGSAVGFALARCSEEKVQCNRGIGGEIGFRHAHLTVAVIDAPLHGLEGAVRYPVGGPSGDYRAGSAWRTEHRQLLHANTLALLAVAACAGKVPRAGAMEEQRAA